MAGAPPVGRRARTTRTTPSNYVRTTLLFGAQFSSRLLVASGSPPAVLHGPLASGTAQTPFVRSTLLVSALGRISSPPAGRTDHSAAELPKPHPSDLLAQPACCTAHFRELPAQASRSPVDLYFFLRFGTEAYICTTRHGQEHTGINLARDQRHGLSLLREPIGLHTPLVTEPDRPSRDPFGLRAPWSRSSCRGSSLVVLLGKEQAVLVECLGFLVW